MSHAAPHSTDETYDQWLVLRAQGGDEDAMRLLVGRWSPRLARHATRLTGDPHGAADATQEAWVAIVRGLPSLSDPACFRRWAYRIVGNKCADWVRRRQRSRERSEPLSSEPEARTSSATGDDRAAALEHAITQLSSKDRAVLTMHYTEQMPLTEIADALGVPVGTVKSRLYHARSHLRDAIASPSINPESHDGPPHG